jgi:hypothetical protein
MDKHYALKGVRTKPSKKNPEGIERDGLYKCAACRSQFTVRMGTIFEETRLPLHKWLQAIHLMCSSKNGISAHQLHRVLECTYKTAWFLAYRIREATRSDDFTPMGGNGKAPEADETCIGRLAGVEKQRGLGHENTVLALGERGGICPFLPDRQRHGGPHNPTRSRQYRQGNPSRAFCDQSESYPQDMK